MSAYYEYCLQWFIFTDNTPSTRRVKKKLNCDEVKPFISLKTL